MSNNRRYIELYSGSRNRSQFPLPSSYEVPFSSTRQILKPTQAYDPLATGPIYYTWQGGNPYPVLTTPAPSPPPPPTQFSCMSGSNTGSILLPIPYTVGKTTKVDYFIGYCLTNVRSGETRKIQRFIPNNNSFIPDEAFTSLILSPADQFTITDPSTSTKIYLPSLDLNGISLLMYDNAYDGYYIIDETLSTSLGYIVSTKIIYYESSCQLATVDVPFPAGFQITDTFTLRQTLPQEKYILDTPNTANLNIFISSYYSLPLPGIVMYLPKGVGIKSKNGYAGKYVYHAYNENLIPNTIPNPIVKSTVYGGGIYGLYYIKASQYDPFMDQVELLISVDSTNDYNGEQIPNYNPITMQGSAINIISYLKDNFNPLNYNGTMVSVNEAVCYEVELVSLIMPNLPLITGSRLVFYPFVYVELANISSPSGASNDIIYSNNPPSNRAMFISPVTDTNQPISSSFMKISSPMTQTVKFKPNDSLRFSVYLPDGRLFQTIQTDYLSPYPPNIRLQIEAIFSIRRMVPSGP